MYTNAFATSSIARDVDAFRVTNCKEMIRWCFAPRANSIKKLTVREPSNVPGLAKGWKTERTNDPPRRRWQCDARGRGRT